VARSCVDKLHGVGALYADCVSPCVLYTFLTRVSRIFMVPFGSIRPGTAAVAVDLWRSGGTRPANQLADAGKMVKTDFHHSSQRHNMLCI